MPGDLRILVLEDAQADAELLQRQLRHDGLAFEARVVDDRDGLVEELAAFDPQLVISDYALPTLTGLEALRIVRGRSATLPFILVTGHVGEERAVEALKMGATDFLLKDRLARLAPCIERAIRAEEERQERLRLEEMFHQAQKMEAVGQLTGGLAHDFNNILAIIIGYLELLERDVGKNRAVRARVRKAIAASHRASDLIDRLLTFSRRRSLEPRDFDMNKATTQAIDLARASLDPSIEVALRLEPGLWPAHGDPTLFAAAVTNLVINARDAMPGGGRLTLETVNRLIEGPLAAQSDVAPGAYAMLVVADTGTGISRDHLAHVLEPFFTTKEVGKGTGLGLSMAYGFAKQSGGHLDIESEVGAGTVVRLCLPRGEAIPGPRARRSAKRAVAGTATVLVVEDDPEVRSLVVSRLEQLGYRVLQAAGARQALDVLNSSTAVDLLFADLIMPGGMTGQELALEARVTRPRLRVLLTSGRPGVEPAGAEPGVQRWPLVKKPYAGEELIARIQQALADP